MREEANDLRLIVLKRGIKRAVVVGPGGVLFDDAGYDAILPQLRALIVSGEWKEADIKYLYRTPHHACWQLIELSSERVVEGDQRHA